jgi:hypothetical protein
MMQFLTMLRVVFSVSIFLFLERPRFQSMSYLSDQLTIIKINSFDDPAYLFVSPFLQM